MSTSGSSSSTTSSRSASGASATTSSALAFFFVGIVPREHRRFPGRFNRSEGGSAIALKRTPVRHREGPNQRGGAAGPWGLWRHLTGLVGQASNTFSTRPPGPTTASHSTSPPAAVQRRFSASAASSGGSGTAPYIRQIKGGVVKKWKGVPTRENDGSSWSMRCRFFRPPALRPALELQALEIGRSVVHERHRLGQGAVAGHLGDRPVHLLRHPSVRRVALGTRAQLYEMHGLARIELHDVADAMCECHDVGRLFGKVR